MTSSGTPGRAHPPKADIGNRKINGAQTSLTIDLNLTCDDLRVAGDHIVCQWTFPRPPPHDLGH